MKKILLLFLVIIFFVEYAFLAVFDNSVFGINNFLLAFLLVIFLKRNFSESIFWAILVGILVDYFSSNLWGMATLSFLLFLGAIEFFKQKFMTADFTDFTLVFFLFFGMIFYNFLQIILLQFFGVLKLISPIEFFTGFNWITFLTTKIIATIFGILFYKLITMIYKFTEESKINLRS